MVYVAVMGYGTIGSGVCEALNASRDRIAKRVGEEVQLKYVLDLREFPDSPVADKVIHDFSIIENDPEVEVVVETMGGINPAYDFVKRSLLAGKQVITSNKAVVAAHGTELLQIAQEKGLNFQFEASVGGGIPIIRPFYRCFGGETVKEVTGILNGTTNYILTKMETEGSSFDKALKEAQALGYAERDPSADVEGFDTCRKIAILTAMAIGKFVNFEEIPTKGITAITEADFRYAKALGTSIKLLGSSRIQGDIVSSWVEPVMVAAEDPLYAIKDVFNGIVVCGETVGKTMFYGSGAGSLPTASAVVADIIESASHRNRNIPIGWTAEKQEITQDTEGYSYCIRFAGNLQEKEEAEKLLQAKQVLEMQEMNDWAVLTGKLSPAELEAAVKQLTAAGMAPAQILKTFL